MDMKLSTTVAQAIADDRRGADYYKDTGILAEFLSGQFGSTKEVAEQVAKEIASDRKGADYYKDPKILAGFLDGQLGSSE